MTREIGEGTKGTVIRSLCRQVEVSNERNLFCPPQLYCDFVILVLDKILIVWALNVLRLLHSD